MAYPGGFSRLMDLARTTTLGNVQEIMGHPIGSPQLSLEYTLRAVARHIEGRRVTDDSCLKLMLAIAGFLVENGVESIEEMT